MAALTIYPRFDLGTLVTTSPGAEKTSNTGWTVGTNTPVKYKLMEVNAKRSASGWTATVLPSEAPIATDTLISTSALTGSFAAENWSLTLKAISVTTGSTGDGTARLKLYRTANKSAFTELTSGTSLSEVVNLTPLEAQSMMGNLAPGAFELKNEFLAMQIAWQITGAATLATDDVLFREGEAIKLVTANFTEGGGGESTPRQTLPLSRRERIINR